MLLKTFKLAYSPTTRQFIHRSFSLCAAMTYEHFDDRSCLALEKAKTIWCAVHITPHPDRIRVQLDDKTLSKPFWMTDQGVVFYDEVDVILCHLAQKALGARTLYVEVWYETAE